MVSFHSGSHAGLFASHAGGHLERQQLAFSCQWAPLVSGVSCVSLWSSNEHGEH